jgi:hypothetical protein
MGWIVPSLGSLAVGAADDAILREKRARRRDREEPAAPRIPDADEQVLIDRMIRLPVHVRFESVRRSAFNGRRAPD